MIKIIMSKVLSLCFFMVLYSSLNGQSFKVPFTILEASDTLSVEEVISSDHLFKNADELEKSSPSSTYWIKLDFKEQNDRLQKNDLWFLRFRNFDFATLYYQEEDRIKQYIFGEFDTYSKDNPAIQSKNWFFPFTQNNLIKKRFIYLKVKRVRYFQSIKNWQFRYTASEEKELVQNYYSKNDLNRLIPIYVFTGVCFIMFLITFVSFLALKKMEFLFYTLYIFGLFLYLCGYTFNLNNILFGSYQIMSYWFFQIMQVFINLCYVIFVLYYLNTKTNYPKLHRALLYIVIILGLIILLDTMSFLTGYYAGHIYLMDFQRLIMSIFGFAGMIYLIFKAKDRLAFFVVSGSLLYTLGALGLLFLNNRDYMIGGATVEIAIFGLGLVYKIRQGYAERIYFERESYVNINKALRAQMNPHFIFNSLSSIQHLITSGKKAEAIKYLNKFSKLMRSLLESSIETSVILDDEIKMLKAYLELESLRFDHTFQYDIEIEDEIDTHIVEVPLLIIQPFVENAIIHGLLPKENGEKKLNITFRKDESYLLCVVDDNGVGRYRKSIKSNFHKNKKSRGLEVTEKRLQILNPKGETTKNIQIIDKMTESGDPLGTSIIIKIPVT